jgi:hypothetical protein
MARTYAMQAKLQWYYIFDIEQPVGVNCPNARDDVMLAQYLLGVWLSRIPYDPEIDTFLKDKLPVSTDGIFGNKTKAYIEAFEIWCNRPGQGGVTADSRLDPMGAASKKIWRLNTELFFAGGLQGGIPATAIRFPPELKANLFR